MAVEASSGSRVNDSILARIEGRVLIALAERMPAWVRPDHLTSLGVAGAVVTIVGYVLSARSAAWLWLASLGIAINWLGDSLDGTLARVRKIERPRYGFLVDHTTDLVSQALIAFGLGLSPFVRFDVACLAFIAYLLAAACAFIRRIASGTLGIAYLGVGPTEVRISILVMNALLYFIPPPLILSEPVPLNLADLAIIASSVVTVLAVLLATTAEWRRLSREDPPR
jgi:phosphatidylglycerophosphate synthase